jgi:hypothetical protein
MKIVAIIELANQIGPDDYRVCPVTKIFDSSATIDEIHNWAQKHGKFLMNDIKLTQPEE